MTATLTEPQTQPTTRALEMLTDEELSLLAYGPGAVVTPYFSDLKSADLEIVQRTAYRSLVARGIVEPDLVPDDGPSRLKLREDVLTLTTLRATATTLVAVARTLVGAQDFWYAHVVGEIVLLEEVDTQGMHRFALGYTNDLPQLLLAAVLHPEATDGTGEVVSIDAMPDAEAPAALLALLGQAHVRADVLVITADPETGRPAPGGPEFTGLFTGPEGSWSITSSPETGAAATPETVAGLHDRINALAAAAMAEGATS